MKPIEFPGCNIVFGVDQPPYLPLPAHLDARHGIVTSCWRMSWRERLTALITGRIYVKQLKGVQLLQPQRLSVTRGLP